MLVSQAHQVLYDISQQFATPDGVKFCWKNNCLALKEGSSLLKNPAPTMFNCL